jgi:hypothetical protein
MADSRAYAVEATLSKVLHITSIFMTEVCRVKNRSVYTTKNNSVALKTAIFLFISLVSPGRDPSPRPPPWVKVLTFLDNLRLEPSRFCNPRTMYVTVSSRVQTGFYIKTPQWG